MSTTTFVHEITERGFDIRVTLTLNAAEAASLGVIAGAAIDASVLAPDIVDKETAENAQELMQWAIRSSTALGILEGHRSSSDDKE